MQKIGIYSFFNQYESKRYFAKQLEKSLNKLGVDTLLIDPLDGQLTIEIDQQMRAFDPDFTLSFNTILPSSKGLFLWDYSGIPHLSILLDPAFYSLNLLKSPFSRISSVDLTDCEWLKQEYGVNCLFWPHATEPFADPYEKKIYDISFLGTCTDYEAIEKEWRHSLTHLEQSLLEQALHAFWSFPLKSYREVLKSAENRLDIRYDRLFYYLDQYVRGKDRVELIRSIKNATVHVFGEPSWNNPVEGTSWRKYLSKQNNVILHEAVSFAKSLQVMSQSKISLNSSPFFKHGSHERFLNALALGSLPLTTHNGFVDQFFNVGEDLLTYRSGDWQQVNDMVSKLLIDEKNRLEIVFSGRNKVLHFHTWDQRAKELLDSKVFV